jgi:hypothetical protein
MASGSLGAYRFRACWLLGCCGPRSGRSGVVSAVRLADGGCGGQDEPGGGLGGLDVQVVQDAGVGVGGEHDAGVPELLLDGLQVGAGGVTGRERCSNRANASAPEVGRWWHSSVSVIWGAGEFGGVGGPVGGGVVRPAGRGGRVDAYDVGEDRGG